MNIEKIINKISCKFYKAIYTKQEHTFQVCIISLMHWNQSLVFLPESDQNGNFGDVGSICIAFGILVHVYSLMFDF